MMKGTQPHHVCAGLAQLNVISYDFDNIGSCANIFNLIHVLFPPCGTASEARDSKQWTVEKLPPTEPPAAPKKIFEARRI